MDERESVERILDGRAWDEFCESLKGARAALFRESSPANAFTVVLLPAPFTPSSAMRSPGL